MGRSFGFEEGYAAGWDAAEDVTVSRILLDHQVLADLSPRGKQYDEIRARTAAGPCDDPACRSCPIRRAAMAANLRAYGTVDYPGTEAIVAALLREAS